jgi:hypothetical protein
MYAKVFSQIFDSSIADNFRLRHFFMDLLVLADPDGVVDMTPTSIAARTRIPLEDVSTMLATLEQPDPESRTPDHDGRRIAKLDEHRTWGWAIINYSRFREIASEEQRREKTRIRVARFKQKRQQKATGNASVTLGNAGNAKQRQKHTQMQKQKEKQMEPEMTERVASLSRFQKPDLICVKFHAAKIGLPDAEAEKFFSYYESNGWRVGKNPMKSLDAALVGWKLRWEERRTPPPKPRPIKSGERVF